MNGRTHVTYTGPAAQTTGVVVRKWDPPPASPERPQPRAAVAYYLAYERYVEAPRRAGRDPVWDSLWAEATSGQTNEGQVA